MIEARYARVRELFATSASLEKNANALVDDSELAKKMNMIMNETYKNDRKYRKFNKKSDK